MQNTNVHGDSSLQNAKRWALSVLVGVCLAGALPSTATAGAVVTGFDSTEIARNDDGSEGPVAIGFTVNYFGESATTAYVNTNGNITLDGFFSDFSPFALATTTPPRRLIAPFFGDVDTSIFGNPVAYGAGTFAGRSAFGASWRNVAFYGSQGAGPGNTFQVILVERGDVGAGDFDIVFNYDQISWETGTFTGGDVNGLGGNSARVGYTTGTGDPGTFYELPGGGVPGTFIDGGTAPLINGTFNSGGVLGRYTFAVRNGTVTPPTGFDCSDLGSIVGVWGLTSGRCGNFESTTTTARYESAMFNYAPPQIRGEAIGEYAYEVELVANRPKQPSGSTSILVAGSPLPLRTGLQNWDRGIAFNISANGKYSIFQYNGTAAPKALQKWATPAGVAINAAPASNLLKVERVTSLTSPSGYELVFSLNGVVVKQLPDTYGVDQFGTGFVRSIATTNNLVTDDWMEILDVTLTVPPALRAAQAASGLVSRDQLRANEKANEARGNDDPLFSSPVETGRLGRGR